MSVKANELRRGNALIYGAHGIVIVDEIKRSGKVRVMHTEQHSIDKGYSNSLLPEGGLDPIPLTEEWLKRTGFKEEEWFKGVYSYGDFSIVARDYQSVVMGHDDFVPFGKSLLFVHQLQNLFYALTGEELTIKEPA